MTYIPYILLFTPLLTWAVTTTPNTGDQTNGFLFDYIRSYPAPLPIIESCPGQLQFGPISVPFGGAEPAPPFTAMYVFPFHPLPSLPSPLFLLFFLLFLPSRTNRGEGEFRADSQVYGQ